MKSTFSSLALLASLFAFPALPQSGGTPSMSADIRKAYETIKGNLTKTLDKMPEADYGFKPTPIIRSFAEVIGHVANAQIHSCAAVLGESKSVDVAGKTSKADLEAAMKESFAECDKAYASLTDANANEAIKTPRGQASRIGTLAANTTHSVEQYAILSVYMRLKNVVPPSSDK
jgi:hypothetical protein